MRAPTPEANSLTQDRQSELVVKHARRDFAKLRVNQTVGESLESLRRHPPQERIVYFYVLDEENRLQGVVPTRRLLLNPPDARIADIMVRQVITIPATATVLDACEYFVLHRLLAFPVTDADGRVLGVIDVELYTDEMADLEAREESEDVFQLIGVRLAQIRQAAVLAVFARRFPWLLCNIAGGLLCAGLVANYQEVLDRAIVLALFIPVVLALAESVSIQSLTLALQSQHVRRPTWATMLRTLPRETIIGILLGLASGTLVAVAALVWKRQAAVAVCILASIALAMTTAALLGLVVPGLLRAFERDPKVAAGPIVLATADLAALFYYFTLAVWLLD